MDQHTHFIQVWKGQITGIVYNDGPNVITDLDLYIKASNDVGAITIAVWKIKIK